MKILDFTENTISLYVDEDSDELNNRKLVYILNNLRSRKLVGIDDYSLSYNSLVIHYTPHKIEPSYIKKDLVNIEKSYTSSDVTKKTVVEIPVCYDEEFGLDQKKYQDKGLSQEEIISLHTEKDYLIFMIGFLPGFPFLNGVNEKLRMERLTSPRTSIPKGSVGIAGTQTGIYPSSSPGGWNIIGRTPVELSNFKNNFKLPFQAGDFIKFVAVTRDEYNDIRTQIKAEKYNFTVTERDF